MTRKPLLYALISLMIVGWTGNYVAGKLALETIPPLLLCGLRISMAGILMLPVYARERRRNRQTWSLRDLPLLMTIGVFGVTLNQCLFVVGLSRTSVAHASIFGNMTPMLVLLLAGARGIEKLSARKITGVAVSLAGVVLLRALDSGPQGAATFLGDFLTFCGALAFAIFTVLGKPTAKHYGSITVNTVAYVGGAILLAPLTLWQAARFPLAGIPWSGWAAVFYMALVPSVVCYLIYYYALAHMEASRLSAFNYLLPPLGMITGVWLLGEHVTLWTMLGAAVIFGGIYLVESTR